MNADCFDTIARSFAGRLSRRAVLRRGGAGLAAGTAWFGLRRSALAAQEQVCTDPARPGVGCACTTGAEHPCGDNTLLCCSSAPDAAPGSPGVCTPSSVGCNPRGLTCTTHGCRCDGGTRHACDDPLVCCPDNPGLPGGPGRCVRQEHCNPRNCKGEGCSCHSGAKAACDAGLVCCADDSSLAGGPGRCEQEAICFRQQCQATTNPCPSQCGSGVFCQQCCSGYCGSDGHCATPPCSGVGCECTAGVAGTCAEGLVCCQSVMNGGPAPGGPGMCATPDGCGNGGSGSGQGTPATP